MSTFLIALGAVGILLLEAAPGFVFVKKNKIVTDKLKGSDPQLVGSTNGGEISKDTKLASAKGFYVLTENTKDSYASLYFVSFKDGETTKILSKCYGAMFGEDNFIIYSDSKGTVKCGYVDLKDAEIDDERSLGKELSNIKFAQASTKYIYYTICKSKLNFLPIIWKFFD